jgi:hypothetical protein
LKVLILVGLEGISPRIFCVTGTFTRDASKTVARFDAPW